MIERVFDAARELRRYLDSTPTLLSPLLSKRFGSEVWLKLECDSPVGSFKARGAFRCLLERSREGHKVFVTASSGNHGTAVAYAGRALGLETHVFVPASASARKLELISAFTPHSVRTDTDFDAAKEIAARFASNHGHYFIDDGAEMPIVEGTGTIALEILKVVTPDVVLVPVGNGALICGIATVIKQLAPGVRVLGIQPEDAPTMYRSFREKRPVQLDRVSSIADGLVSRIAVPQAVELMNRVVDEVLLVSETELRDAVRLFVETECRILEPSSAAAIAVLSRPELRGKRAVAIITGRNIEIGRLKELL